MREKLLKLFENNPYTTVITGESKGKLTSLDQSPEALLIASSFNKENRNIVVVKKNLFQAQRFYSQVTQLIDVNDVVFFAVDESLRVEAIASSPEMAATRNESMARLLFSNEKKLVVTHTAAIARHLPLPEVYKDCTLHISVDEEYDIKSLKTILNKAGYQYTSKVDQPMTFASRGGIIDVFALNHENPIRIEFFDNVIESIRYFDVVSQRTIEVMKEAYITPASEILFNENQINEICTYINTAFSKVKNKDSDDKDILRSNLDSDIENLEKRQSENSLYKYLGILEDKANILDYVNNPLIVVSTYDEVESSFKQLMEETLVYMQELYEENKSLLLLNQYFDVRDVINRHQNIQIDSFKSKGMYAESQILPLTLLSATFTDTMNLLIQRARKHRVCLCLMQPHEKRQVENYLKEFDLYLHDMSHFEELETGFFVLSFAFEEGFECLNENITVVSSKELFKKRAKIARYANKFKEADIIKNYQELHSGDYVVHEQYGVGQYLGIETKEIDGLHKDFLKVVYKGNDTLLIPLEQFHLIRKFIGKGGAVPKIHKLGTNEWEKTKNRIREKVNDLAERLINLYALREEKIGFAFSEDSILQREFEDAFEYELTRDQSIAIDEIKRDMESQKPMDRLLCGDVGFGKTEVAIRAAFKAILDNKQVAYLCPTTILSRQHYETFMKRCEDFPVSIAVINRFVDPARQKEIIRKVKNHEVDIVIGTHRLLSKDIQFDDLGLLIIDEEQRFGVEHKEKIKELKNGVDVLSLSATPIPRTLQMSLVGIRQLSQLDTPPRNRLPVQTYVIEKNDSVINEVIERELARDGQIFYLYNNVNRIYEVARSIEKRIPGSRVGVAHGQMDRDEIEDVMEKFTFNEFNILVCTTIIETGIDIPNANTIIIEDADRFGLAQLYQIKGRVGRSDRLAYAYLLYQPEKNLNEIAMKRLQSIKEFTQLGSGYKIAMRDLAIRGAGDMLGPEQAGFIDTVGMDLYIEMLSDAIKSRKDPNYTNETKEVNRLHVDAYLPAEFEHEDLQKITLYQRIEKTSNKQEIDALKDEVVDRYGKLPKEVALLFDKKYMELLLNSTVIDNFKEQKTGLDYTLTKVVSDNLDGLKLFETVNKISRAIKIKYSNGKITISVPKSGNMLNYAMHILELIEKGLFNK